MCPFLTSLHQIGGSNNNLSVFYEKKEKHNFDSAWTWMDSCSMKLICCAEVRVLNKWQNPCKNQRKKWNNRWVGKEIINSLTCVHFRSLFYRWINRIDENVLLPTAMFIVDMPLPFIVFVMHLLEFRWYCWHSSWSYEYKIYWKRLWHANLFSIRIRMARVHVNFNLYIILNGEFDLVLYCFHDIFA